MKCIFCEIVNRNSPAEIIFEDEKIIAFLDNKPFNFGHSLVIPKIHCEDFLSVPEDHLMNLISAVQAVSKAVLKGLDVSGFNIISNNGKTAGQSVFHFHFHIIPRFKSDKHKYRLNLKSYAPGEMKRFAESIKNFVNNQE